MELTGAATPMDRGKVPNLEPALPRAKAARCVDEERTDRWTDTHLQHKRWEVHPSANLLHARPVHQLSVPQDRRTEAVHGVTQSPKQHGTARLSHWLPKPQSPRASLSTGEQPPRTDPGSRSPAPTSRFSSKAPPALHMDPGFGKTTAEVPAPPVPRGRTPALPRCAGAQYQGSARCCWL